MVSLKFLKAKLISFTIRKKKGMKRFVLVKAQFLENLLGHF